MREALLLAALATFFLGQIQASAAPPAAVAEPEAATKTTQRNAFPAGQTELDRYVAQADPSFAWKVVSRHDGDDATVLVIDLTSQTWRSADEVDRHLWKHWLVLTVPKGATTDTALLLIGGGANGREAPAGPSDRARAVAMATKSPVAELGQVPNQPLVFRGDGEERVEDDLIGQSWEELLHTGDLRWAAQLPMAKSAVRAMDAIQAAAKENDLPEIKKFVVAGASKRGWTTWLTAAVDSRVVAIAPIVIDVLNVPESMKNHHAAYGYWAPALDDYEHHGLTNLFGDPRVGALYATVDPFSYRQRYTMPKCLINATGDEFFTPDSSKFYFDDLVGEKFLCYVPNASHSLDGSNALDTLIAFHSSVIHGLPRPKVTWDLDEEGAWHVSADPAPARALLWQASNDETRDFRVDTIGKAFTSEPLTSDSTGKFVAHVDPPSHGYRAYFVQLEFDIGAAAPLRVSTPVHITPDTLPFAEGSDSTKPAAVAAP